MLSNNKSELDQLREWYEKYADIIDSLNSSDANKSKYFAENWGKVLDLINRHVVDYEDCTEAEIPERAYDIIRRALDTDNLGWFDLDISSLDKRMMFEKLCNNWDNLSLSDIDAICRI